MKLENYAANSVSVLREARKFLGSSKAVTEWLNTPLREFLGKSPAELLYTEEGYRTVMEVLRKDQCGRR